MSTTLESDRTSQECLDDYVGKKLFEIHMTTPLRGHELPTIPEGLTVIAEGVQYVTGKEFYSGDRWVIKLHPSQESIHSLDIDLSDGELLNSFTVIKPH